MKKEDVRKLYTTPVGAPAFVKGPHRFTNREYLNIVYRTDRDALLKVVPEPLEIDEPLVRFGVMKMPDSTGYGVTSNPAKQPSSCRNVETSGDVSDNLPQLTPVEVSAYPKLVQRSSSSLGRWLAHWTMEELRSRPRWLQHSPLDLEGARRKLQPDIYAQVMPGYTGPWVCVSLRTQITNLTIKGPGLPRHLTVVRARAPRCGPAVREVVWPSIFLRTLFSAGNDGL
jgi:acetoacetate decarboxylase